MTPDDTKMIKKQTILSRARAKGLQIITNSHNYGRAISFLTIFNHAYADTLLIPAIRAVCACLLINIALLVTQTHVLGVFLYRSLNDMESIYYRKVLDYTLKNPLHPSQARTP